MIGPLGARGLSMAGAELLSGLRRFCLAGAWGGWAGGGGWAWGFKIWVCPFSVSAPLFGGVYRETNRNSWAFGWSFEPHLASAVFG